MFWVCSGQCLKAAIKSGPISDRIMVTQGSMMRVVQSNRRPTVAQTPKVTDAGCHRKAPEYTVYYSLLHHFFYTTRLIHPGAFFCLSFFLSNFHTSVNAFGRNSGLTGAGIKLLTFQLVHELLYLLSQSHPKKIIFFLIHRKSK